MEVDQSYMYLREVSSMVSKVVCCNHNLEYLSSKGIQLFYKDLWGKRPGFHQLKKSQLDKPTTCKTFELWEQVKLSVVLYTIQLNHLGSEPMTSLAARAAKQRAS